MLKIAKYEKEEKILPHQILEHIMKASEIKLTYFPNRNGNNNHWERIKNTEINPSVYLFIYFLKSFF